MLDPTLLAPPLAGVLGAFIGNCLTAVIHRYPALLDAEVEAELAELMRIQRGSEISRGEPPEDNGSVAEQAGGDAGGPEGGRDATDSTVGIGTPGLLDPARCAHCAHPLGFAESLPIIGYVLRRGRCGHCQGAIPTYMPLVECLTAAGFALVAYRYGIGLQSLLGLLGVTLLIALSGIDLRTCLLPDRLSLPGIWVGLLASTLGIFTDPVSAIYGAALGYLLPWASHVAFHRLTGAEGMGHGDFKLAAMLGAWFGWQVMPMLFLVAFGLGGLWALVLLATGRRGRRDAIPFGPFIATAGMLCLTIGLPQGFA